MGIGSDFAEAIITEHTFRPITGDVLTVGRQTVYLTVAETIEMMRDHNVPVAVPADHIGLNQSTVNRLSEAELISDAAFLGLLGANSVKAIDHSDYEGAEIIHDLSMSVPDALANSADVLIDGSTLDNVFDPVGVLTNYAKILRPGGRLLAINAWALHPSAYVLPSPLWFLDYFVWNAWADCKVYLLCYPYPGLANVLYCDPGHLMERGKGSANPLAACEMTTVIIAEKGAESTAHLRPIQGDYRSEADWDRYRRNLAAFALVHRPHVVRSRGPLVLDRVPDGYLYVDKWFQALHPAAEAKRLRDEAQAILVRDAAIVEARYESHLKELKHAQELRSLRSFAFHHSPSWVRWIIRALLGTSQNA